jgi:hypothetical protein
MALSSKNYDEHTAALWRGHANNKVVYTEDFPAALLTGTEFTDNSLGKGRATRIEWTFDMTDPRAGIFTIRDNGNGIEGQSDLIRFLKIGSHESSDAFHQYAQGRICAMTKFMPIYETAEWTATFKFDGHPTKLSQISQPWSTPENMQRAIVKIPMDETNRDLGFEMKIKFDMSIFGELDNVQDLFAKTKERLTTKYDATIFEQTEFVLTVINAEETKTESSRTNQWKTFEQMLQELPESCCKVVFDKTFTWKSISTQVTEYFLTLASQKSPEMIALREAFPTFATRCESAQRAHIINNGRLIESRHKPAMEGRKADNHQNGEIVFVKSWCDGGDFSHQPVPSTIKVSIVDKCENLSGIYTFYLAEKKRLIDEANAEKAAREKAAKEALKAEKAKKKADAAAAAAAVAKEAVVKKQSVNRTSPSMPRLEPILLLNPSSPAVAVVPVELKDMRDFTEAMRLISVKFISPESIESYKSFLKEKYGVAL